MMTGKDKRTEVNDIPVSGSDGLFPWPNKTAQLTVFALRMTLLFASFRSQRAFR